MDTTLMIEYIIKNRGAKTLIIATVIEGDPSYKPDENLKLNEVEVQRAMPPRTEPRRFDLLAFTPRKNDEADGLKAGQVAVLSM